MRVQIFVSAKVPILLWHKIAFKLAKMTETSSMWTPNTERAACLNTRIFRIMALFLKTNNEKQRKEDSDIIIDENLKKAFDFYLKPFSLLLYFCPLPPFLYVYLFFQIRTCDQFYVYWFFANWLKNYWKLVHFLVLKNFLPCLLI